MPETSTDACQKCGGSPAVAQLAMVGPNGWLEGPLVYEPCEDEYFARAEALQRDR